MVPGALTSLVEVPAASNGLATASDFLTSGTAAVAAAVAPLGMVSRGPGGGTLYSLGLSVVQASQPGLFGSFCNVQVGHT